MTLTENRLYKSNELQSEMHIADGVSVMIYDTEDVLKKLTFGKWSSLQYFGYFETQNSFDKHFLINGIDARCEVYALLSSRGEEITAKINGKLAASWAFLDMNIVSFVSDNGVIDLDGIVHITEWIEKVEGYLVEENIFIGQTWKVRWLPTLLVHSDDVKAAHACNMERISDDKLFYLRSRGLPREDATILMLESYIAKTFWKLEEVEETLYTELKERILERIKQK